MLNIDRYHATMGDASYKEATRLHATPLSDAEATFYVSQRKLPYAPCLGHERLLRSLLDLRIDRPRLRTLEQDRGGLHRFAKAVEDINFVGTVRAVRPGTIMFAGQPFADITGAFGLAQAQEIKFEHAFDLPMTTASIAMQIRAGAGSRWLSDYPWTRVTVEHLATHTSGICDYGNTNTVCRNENGDWQEDYERAKSGGTGYKYPNDALTIARARSEQNRQPAAAPGSVDEYSNLGHVLMNYVVQQACGRKLSDIYASYIKQGGMGSPVEPAQIYTDGGRIWTMSAGTARWYGRDGAAVLRLAGRLGIWNNRNVEPVRYWNEVTKITGNLPVAMAHGRGVVYYNNSTNRWTQSAGHRRWSNEMFGHDGNFSTVFLTDPLSGTIIVRQGKNNAPGASYLTLNGCQPGWTGTAPTCKPGTDWSNNWGVARTDSRESDYVAGRKMVTDPLQEAFFFPPPFCRMVTAGGRAVDDATDVYDSPADAAAISLAAEITVNPREGAGSSVADRVEFYKESGDAVPEYIGNGVLVGGTSPARYELAYDAQSHGPAGEVRTYFASCVAKSTVDENSRVPSYSRPVRVRR